MRWNAAFPHTRNASADGLNVDGVTATARDQHGSEVKSDADNGTAAAKATAVADNVLGVSSVADAEVAVEVVADAAAVQSQL